MTGRTRAAVGILSAIAAIGGLAACEPPPPPTSFVVNTGGTGTDADPGDGICEVTPGAGDCTLQAATGEGNALGGRIDIGIGGFPGGIYVGEITVATDTTIDAHGVQVDVDLDHQAGALTLRNMHLNGPIDSGCDDPSPDPGLGLTLDTVTNTGTDEYGVGTFVCAAGALAIIRADISTSTATDEPAIEARGPVLVHGSTVSTDRGPALRVSGPGPLTVSSTVLVPGSDQPMFDAPDASGRVVYSFIDGSIGQNVEVAASRVHCNPGEHLTSGGYNIDPNGDCGLDDPTDRIVASATFYAWDLAGGVPLQWVPIVDTPVVGAIPAGTSGLCDGSWPLDYRNQPRRGDRDCDVGPYQTQVTVTVDGVEETRPVDAERSVRVNASGTVAATFVDEEGAGSVGRWFADGSLETAATPGSEVADISDDGVVVGRVWVDDHFEPWRWDPGSEPTTVENPAGTTSGELLAIDDVDGTVVGLSDGPEPVLWFRSPGGPIVALPTPVGAMINAVHGGTAVGHRNSPSEGRVAVTWDLATGDMTDLAPVDLVWGDNDSSAFDIAADGSVVGHSNGPARWSVDGAPSPIGLAYDDQEAVAATSTGHALIVDPYSAPYGSCGPFCGMATIVPAGTTEKRLLAIDFLARDLGDDGTLVGVRATSAGPTDAELVRTHLAIGD